MKKRHKITTKDREIYDKFNLLHFSSEIVLDINKITQINRILRHLNKNNECVCSEKIGNYILLKKIKPINFDIYLK